MTVRALAVALMASLLGAAAIAQPAQRPRAQAQQPAPTPAPTPAPAAPAATPAPAPPAAQPTSPPAAQDQPPAADTRPAYQVEGFRSARLNMTEQEVREAINRDFPATGTGIRRTGNIDTQANRVYRTTALVVTVRDLMPDTGTARVEYILGYQSHKLIQVNVIWGTPADPQAPLDVVQTAAARLQTFFLQENFPPERRAANVQQGNELVMFRGRDAQGRTVEVVAQVQAPTREGQRGSHFVRLSYILNPEQPDVFTLRRGDF
jgi:hypothetical protein